MQLAHICQPMPSQFLSRGSWPAFLTVYALKMMPYGIEYHQLGSADLAVPLPTPYAFQPSHWQGL